MELILLAVFIMNYNYTRSEVFEMCKDLKTEKCMIVKKEFTKAQKNIDDFHGDN